MKAARMKLISALTANRDLQLERDAEMVTTRFKEVE